MDLQYTLEHYALQLKSIPRTLINVAGVVQQIMKTLYDFHFPNAETRRPRQNPETPDSDILTIAWKPLEYIGVSDSEHDGYPRLKVQLQTLFPSLPERSRLNRPRRNLMAASEVLRQTLRTYFPQTDVFIVDSFPIPICDLKRAKSSTSDLKWADASGCLATYGTCATKGLGTFFGFRGHLITRTHIFAADAAKQSEATIFGGSKSGCADALRRRSHNSRVSCVSLGCVREGIGASDSDEQ